MKRFKRIIGFCLLFFSLFCLISCESNKETLKLNCSKLLTDKEGLTTYMTSTSEYEGDTIVKVSIKWTAKYDKTKYTEDEIMTLSNDTAESYKKEYGDSKNIKISSGKVDDGEYGVIIMVDYENLTQEEKDKYGFNFPDGLEKSKSDFEASGYTCK
jgi:hypothetical protein